VPTPEEALRAYVEAFETLDADAVVPFYHTPCMFIAPQGVFVAEGVDAARGVASRRISSSPPGSRGTCARRSSNSKCAGWR